MAAPWFQLFRTHSSLETTAPGRELRIRDADRLDVRM